jgi:hypothetical protein
MKNSRTRPAIVRGENLGMTAMTVDLRDTSTNRVEHFSSPAGIYQIHTAKTFVSLHS